MQNFNYRRCQVKTQRWHAPQILVRLIWISLAILLMLQACDTLSTIRFVRVFGIEAEDNLLARVLFYRYGVAGLWLHKLLIIPFIVPAGCILLQLSRKHLNNEKKRALLIGFLSIFLVACTFINAKFVATVIANLAAVP